MTKQKIYFLGYFLLFPTIFIVSSFLWRFLIRSNDLLMVLTDSLSILAIYYFIVSIFFVVRIK